MTNEAKLAELRAKTSGELAQYVSRELNLGVHLATGLDAASSRAEDIYTELSRLLPVLQDLEPSERRRLEAKWRRLREILDAAVTWRTSGSVGATAS